MLTRLVAFAKFFKGAAEMLSKQVRSTTRITQIPELLTYITESRSGSNTLNNSCLNLYRF